ncbi:hypothetical protein RQP46_006174 [Phenoliferia psychrophenolica]
MDSDDEDNKPILSGQPTASTSRLPEEEEEEDVKADQLDSDSDINLFDSGSDGEDDENNGQLKYDNGRVRLERSPPPAKIKGRPYFASRCRLPTMQAFTYRHLLQEGPDGEAPVIDLYPLYQRDAVWPAAHAMDLMRSIASHFPVPALVFNSIVRNEETGKTTLVCMDGKQRLTSLMRFMSGKIQLVDDAKVPWVNEKLSDEKEEAMKIHAKATPGAYSKWKPLPAEDREHFDNIVIHANVYDELDSATEQLIFAKIQQGMELTEQEKLKALDSPWLGYGETIETEFISEPKGTIQRMMSKGQCERGKGYSLLLRVHLWLREGVALEDLTAATNGRLQKAVLDPALATPTDGEWRVLTDILTRLRTISLLQEKGDKLHPVFSFRPVAPVELVFLPLIVRKWYSEHDGVILEIIEQFRSAIKKKAENNVSLNAAVVTFAKDWIMLDHFLAFDKRQSLTNKYAADGRLSDAPAAPARDSPSPSPSPSSSSSSSEPLASLPPKPAAKAKPKPKPKPQPAVSVAASPRKRAAPDSAPTTAAPAAKRIASGASRPSGGPSKSAYKGGGGGGAMMSKKVAQPKAAPVVSVNTTARRNEEQGQRNRVLQGSSHATPEPSSAAWGKRPAAYQHPAPNPAPGNHHNYNRNQPSYTQQRPPQAEAHRGTYGNGNGNGYGGSNQSRQYPSQQQSNASHNNQRAAYDQGRQGQSNQFNWQTSSMPGRSMDPRRKDR